MIGAATSQIVFQPLLPWPLLAALAALSAACLILGLVRRMRAMLLRVLAAMTLLLALCGPALRIETREPLSDIVLMLSDQSASNRIGERAQQTEAMVAALRRAVAALPNTELREVAITDGADGEGTLALGAIQRALAGEPANRIAGAVMISDGQAHDGALDLALPAPLNVILTGHRADWDRSLKITSAPAFGIIGQETTIGLRINEHGAMPAAEAGALVDIAVSIDGDEARHFQVAANEDLQLPLTLTHAGQNIVQFTIAGAKGELTDQNNMAVVSINGVRDRLRVLLVSGEPYAGERTWRNLLKSDATVDLVHFTILRSPEKQDDVPVDELALIAFPTRELFVDKIKEFDLIIFDRYALRGLLPAEYLDNIRDYVEGGGALLVAAGAEFASAESLFFSGVGEVLPAAPTTRVIDGAFVPQVSELGMRHPVTAGLEALSPKVHAQGEAPWGKWHRYVELEDPSGDVVMEGPEGAPLLILSHQGEGRTALLASDQAWLWSRGHDGGGPQQELLRRLAHWLMKEPELEEEALYATLKGSDVTLTRRSLKEGGHQVVVTGPDGAEQSVEMKQQSPGLYQADLGVLPPGLYRMREGDLNKVFALGASSPVEYESAVPTAEVLKPAVGASNGGFVWAEDGAPDVRTVRAGRPAAGRGWLGITPRGATRTLDLRLTPPVPDWALLLLVLGLTVVGWLWEGARRRV